MFALYNHPHHIFSHRSMLAAYGMFLDHHRQHVSIVSLSVRCLARNDIAFMI
jgi:hypothetical protein